MSGINNISGASTTSIQHNPSQMSRPAQLVIRTVDEARDHWRAITSRSQASDAMAVLYERAHGGQIDDETYRLLANALRDVHDSRQERAATQTAASLPVHPPAALWQTPATVSAETLAAAVTSIQQGASVAHAAQQHGILNSFDMNHLHIRFTAQQDPPVSAETLAVAVTAIQQGASVQHAAQQHGIRDAMNMSALRAAFNEQPVSAETLAVAVTAIQQGASIARAARQHGIRNVWGMNNLRIAFNEVQRQQNPPVSADTLAMAVTAIAQGASVEHAAQQHGIRDVIDMIRLRAAFRRR